MTGWRGRGFASPGTHSRRAGPPNLMSPGAAILPAYVPCLVQERPGTVGMRRHGGCRRAPQDAGYAGRRAPGGILHCLEAGVVNDLLLIVNSHDAVEQYPEITPLLIQSHRPVSTAWPNTVRLRTDVAGLGI